MKIKIPCPYCLQRLGRISCTCEDCCGSGSVEIEVPERRSTPNETSTRTTPCECGHSRNAHAYSIHIVYDEKTYQQCSEPGCDCQKFTLNASGSCLPRYVTELEQGNRTAVEHASNAVHTPATSPTTVATSRLNELVEVIGRAYRIPLFERGRLHALIETWLKQSLLQYDTLTGPHHEAEWEGECVFAHLVAFRELNDQQRETTYTQTLVPDWEHVVHELERQLFSWEKS